MNNERNAKIVRCWNSGLSTGEVARHVGCTRNVVVATVSKQRELGEITRPMVHSYSEKGRLGMAARFGIKRKRK